MNEQSYGIPYAMHVHDIEEIVVYVGYEEKVNEGLKNGFVLLSIGPWGNAQDGMDVAYVMGIPRPRYCHRISSYIDHPKNETMQWDHVRKEWECRWCTETKANLDNRPPLAF